MIDSFKLIAKLIVPSVAAVTALPQRALLAPAGWTKPPARAWSREQKPNSQCCSPLKIIILQHPTDESWNLQSKPKPKKAGDINYCYKLLGMMEGCLHIWSTRFLKLSYWKGHKTKILLPSAARMSINQLFKCLWDWAPAYKGDALSEKGRRQAEGLKGRQWNFCSAVSKNFSFRLLGPICL